MPKSRLYIVTILVFLFFLISGISYGFDDGFGQARRIEGKHFIIYYAPQLDLSALAQQLNIGIADKILVGKSQDKGFSTEAGLLDMADTLFMQVCDILDMHLYSFQGNIKICQDYEQLNRIYNNLFNKDLKGTRSFYVYELNAIYISSESFKREILGHEIGHAVISHYFVVQPSVKIQEVLAGYVEYQLRKAGQR